MSTEDNKAIVRRVFDELWNNRNLDVLNELWSPTNDIEGFKVWTRSMYTSFSQMKLTILDMIAEGDKVAIHWRVAATHQGDYLGIAATGRPINYQGIAWLRIADGKVVDAPGYWDDLSILQQMGTTTIPTPDEAPS